MNHEFKERIWKMGFSPTLEAEAFEDRLRGLFGLTAKYESARLSIGRSLAETTQPEPLRISSEGRGKAIPGEHLFGEEIDLWISVIAIDGQLGASATADDFRQHAEAHWARGAEILKQDLEDCANDEVRLISKLSSILPTSFGGAAEGANLSSGAPGEVILKVGSVSTTYPGEEPVVFSINGPGTAPHIALMGKNGSGKTTTGVQIARQIVESSGIPLIFIDPKGEFSSNGEPIGALADIPGIRAIEVGVDPIPLDFLPDPSVGSASITQAAMKFRDSLALCCGHPGDIQLDLLRSAVEKVI